MAEGGVATLPDVDATGWTAIVFVGLSSGGGYVLWLWALRHASPTRATAFLSLSPLTAAVLGTALLYGYLKAARVVLPSVYLPPSSAGTAGPSRCG